MAPVVFSKRLHANYELVMLSWWVELNLFTFACHESPCFVHDFTCSGFYLPNRAWIRRGILCLSQLFYLSHTCLSSYVLHSLILLVFPAIPALLSFHSVAFKLSLWSFSFPIFFLAYTCTFRCTILMFCNFIINFFTVGISNFHLVSYFWVSGLRQWLICS